MISMPWRHLSTWFAERQDRPATAPMPLTMVTLRATAPADPMAMAFHAEAEFDALVAWALAGRFVLAFAALDRDELILLCAEPKAAVEAHVSTLPFVAAGLASADLRPVVPLRLTAESPVLLH
jgi:hypothetical protein